MMTYLNNFLGRYKIFFHKFIETSENKRQLKYITKASCYKSFRKKDRQNIHKKWRTILLLNADAKMLSKAFSAKLIPILPSVISSNQFAYVEKRGIREKSRLIFDITEVCGKENIQVYLVTMNLKKLFIP